MEWTQEKTIELIQEFEKNECLWNVRIKDYKDLLKKKDAWCDIAKMLESNVEEVEKKMKSILSAYRREKKKVGTNGVYEPKWFAYKHMLFLHDINRSKKTKDSKKGKVSVYYKIENTVLPLTYFNIVLGFLCSFLSTHFIYYV